MAHSRIRVIQIPLKKLGSRGVVVRVHPEFFGETEAVEVIVHLVGKVTTRVVDAMLELYGNQSAAKRANKDVITSPTSAGIISVIPSSSLPVAPL